MSASSTASPFDLVITVCDSARHVRAVLPAGTRAIHHSFDDPAALVGSEYARLTLFRRFRDEIRGWLAGFAKSPD